MLWTSILIYFSFMLWPINKNLWFRPWPESLSYPYILRPMISTLEWTLVTRGWTQAVLLCCTLLVNFSRWLNWCPNMVNHHRRHGRRRPCKILPSFFFCSSGSHCGHQPKKQSGWHINVSSSYSWMSTTYMCLIELGGSILIDEGMQGRWRG